MASKLVRYAFSPNVCCNLDQHLQCISKSTQIQIITQVFSAVLEACEVIGDFCVQVKAAEKYRDGTDASTDVKARARYTNGEACISDVLLCSAACTSQCLHRLTHPAVLH